jgi:XTP/dITP diphosphohydrolase
VRELANELVLATRNAGKVRELEPLLAAAGWRGLSLDDVGLADLAEDDALESAETFAENALAKARAICALTGRMVMAEDSGLVVDALDGRPGVRSKRWSGRSDLTGSALDAANLAFLQQALAESARMGREERTARFVCAAAVVWPDGELVRSGSVEGELLAAPRGSGGFGYDPIFWSSELACTFAEASREAKSRVSHRGRAVRSC